MLYWMNECIWSPEEEDLNDILQPVRPDLSQLAKPKRVRRGIRRDTRVDPALSELLNDPTTVRNTFHDERPIDLDSRPATPAMSDAKAVTQHTSMTAIDPSLEATSNAQALATRLRTESDLSKAIDPQLSHPERLTIPSESARAQEPSTSPTLSRQTSNGQTSSIDTLRPMDAMSPTQEASVTSSTRETLPSITHLLPTHSLPALAEAATQHYSHHHNQSYSSNGGAQSPVMAQPQISPPTYSVFPAGVTTRSPTSNMTESPYFHPSQTYQSQQTYAPYNYPTNGRHSTATNMPEHGMTLPPSLPSASSSGDSQGPAGSSMDGYSTTHTTPTDHPQQLLDTMSRPAAMMVSSEGFRCTFDGCSAPPFQTQYLLTSHKNVHSQDRPHYCPVQGCSRAEGGRGFKRKNEMIRHGLVHKSPGYICPFCPEEREHKYPRPDNLQRHVRVHHLDKDKDDPLLQEVLNQRNEGQGKTRRRRTTSNPVSAAV